MALVLKLLLFRNCAQVYCLWCNVSLIVLIASWKAVCLDSALLHMYWESESSMQRNWVFSRTRDHLGARVQFNFGEHKTPSRKRHRLWSSIDCCLLAYRILLNGLFWSPLFVISPPIQASYNNAKLTFSARPVMHIFTDQGYRVVSRIGTLWF